VRFGLNFIFIYMSVTKALHHVMCKYIFSN